MSFNNKFGITDIETEGKKHGERFSISFDNDSSNFDPRTEDTSICFLYVPNMDEEEHFHIEINDDAAVKLRDWLSAYLDTKNSGKPYSPICEVCKEKISSNVGNTFVYGKMREGVETEGTVETEYEWVIMCEDCFVRVGVGIGHNKGERYRLETNGRWIRIEG